MAEFACRFKYVPPGLLRGETDSDFLLYYYDNEEGKQMVFSGREPHGDSPGYLDFPPEATWPTLAPDWAKEKRQIIKLRLLEYTRSNPFLNWVTPSNFSPCPGRRTPLTETELLQDRAMCEAPRHEFEAALEEIAATRRKAELTRKISVGALVVSGVLVLAVALLLKLR